MLTVDDIKPGQRLGRYQLVKELGRGAAGFVFLAEDTLVTQKLCVKVLHPRLSNDAAAIARFHREIVLTRRIVHKGVCRVHDLHESDGLKFITMELVDGAPLSALLHKPMPAARAIAIGIGVCNALAAAHEVGVVHRDLKPRNVMVRDAAPSVVLLDFGIATALDVAVGLTLPGRTLGTPNYIPPEVWEGKPATAQSDQFAVGVMLFNMLTTKMPWTAPQDVLLYEAMRNAPAPAPSAVGPQGAAALDLVVRKALAFDPKARFTDIKSLGRALAAIDLDAEGLATVRSPPPARPAPVVFIDATEKIDLHLERNRPSIEDDDLTLPLPSIAALSSSPPAARGPAPPAPFRPPPAPSRPPPAPLAAVPRPSARSASSAPSAPPATKSPARSMASASPAAPALASSARPAAPSARPAAPSARPPAPALASSGAPDVAPADLFEEEEASWVIAGQAAGPPLKVRPQKDAVVFDEPKKPHQAAAPPPKGRGRIVAILVLFVVVTGAALAYLGGFIP